MAMEGCSTDERLWQETLCHWQWTDEYIEHPESLMRQNIIVVYFSDVSWLILSWNYSIFVYLCFQVFFKCDWFDNELMKWHCWCDDSVDRYCFLDLWACTSRLELQSEFDQSLDNGWISAARASTQYSRQMVASFYRHQSSSAATCQAINRR